MIAEEGPEEAARQLDVLVAHVQGAADRQGVTFLATDADKDGGKIILTAGAPSSSGDDEHRMLLAVREIMDAREPASHPDRRQPGVGLRRARSARTTAAPSR